MSTDINFNQQSVQTPADLPSFALAGIAERVRTAALLDAEPTRAEHARLLGWWLAQRHAMVENEAFEHLSTGRAQGTENYFVFGTNSRPDHMRLQADSLTSLQQHCLRLAQLGELTPEEALAVYDVAVKRGYQNKVLPPISVAMSSHEPPSSPQAYESARQSACGPDKAWLQRQALGESLRSGAGEFRSMVVHAQRDACEEGVFLEPKNFIEKAAQRNQPAARKFFEVQERLMQEATQTLNELGSRYGLAMQNLASTVALVKVANNTREGVSSAEPEFLWAAFTPALLSPRRDHELHVRGGHQPEGTQTSVLLADLLREKGEACQSLQWADLASTLALASNHQHVPLFLATDAQAKAMAEHLGQSIQAAQPGLQVALQEVPQAEREQVRAALVVRDPQLLPGQTELGTALVIGEACLPTELVETGGQLSRDNWRAEGMRFAALPTGRRCDAPSSLGMLASGTNLGRATLADGTGIGQALWPRTHAAVERAALEPAGTEATTAATLLSVRYRPGGYGFREERADLLLKAPEGSVQEVMNAVLGRAAGGRADGSEAVMGVALASFATGRSLLAVEILAGSTAGARVIDPNGHLCATLQNQVGAALGYSGLHQTVSDARCARAGLSNLAQSQQAMLKQAGVRAGSRQPSASLPELDSFSR